MAACSLILEGNLEALEDDSTFDEESSSKKSLEAGKEALGIVPRKERSSYQVSASPTKPSNITRINDRASVEFRNDQWEEKDTAEDFVDEWEKENMLELGVIRPHSQRRLKNITEKHPEFELAYDMMMGIRVALGRAEYMDGCMEWSDTELSTVSSDCSTSSFLQRQRIQPEKFAETQTWKFSKKGNLATPAPYGEDFKFKDFCPDVFKSLRSLFGIDPVDYQVEVCGNFGYLEFISNSKSGQFFFYTHNERFIVKTMSSSEVKVFLGILPYYYSYILKHPHSLLTKYFGMHQVKQAGKKTISFLVMGDVFYSNKMLEIHEQYDLKGSSKGRFAGKGETQLKDNDFIQKDRKLFLGNERAKLFKAQLRQDTEFLRSFGIMDYSLLVGIHYRNRSKKVPRETSKAPNIHRLRSYGRNYKAISTPSANQYIVPELVSNKMMRCSSIMEERNHIKIKPYEKNVESIAWETTSDSQKELMNPFTDSYGGMCKRDPVSGKMGNEIYFTGLIDLLQKFNRRKKAENWLLSRFSDSNTISAINQDDYAKRLNNFMEDRII